jgi:hypothetical protein
MLSAAKAEAPASSSDSSLLMLQNAAGSTDVQLFQSAASTPVSILPSSFPTISPNAQTQFGTVPVESVNPVLHYSVIPEPTTTACLLVGLGALLGFKRLKIGRSN